MFAITSTRTHTHTRTQIQYYCWCSCLLLLLYSSFNSLPRGRCPPPTAHCCSAEHCFLFFRPLLRCPFLLVAAFWLIIFCFYTHLNHFTVILLIANFKLLPCGLLPPISHPQTSLPILWHSFVDFISHAALFLWLSHPLRQTTC